MTSSEFGGTPLEAELKKIKEEKEQLNEREKQVETALELKTLVISALEEKYHFEEIINFTESFNDFLSLLSAYLENDTGENKEALCEKVSLLKEAGQFFNNMKGK